MKPMKRHVFLQLLLLLYSGPTEAFIDPFSAMFGAFLVGGVAYMWSCGCPPHSPVQAPRSPGQASNSPGQSPDRRLREVPNPDRVSFNSTGLKNDLDNRLFGQHIASRIVFSAVNGFMCNDNPDKPLVLSLHGTTGTGKNYISKLIAENIYKKGMESSYFHVFPATHHFPLPQEHLHTYKAQLKQWIKEGVSKCERSMFIFDEVDKMHPDLIDSISPYLDNYAKLDGVSYRKSIFIFLSNTGGEIITEKALDFWKAGRKREEIEYKHLEASLSRLLFNDKNSGFFRSKLIYKSMVDLLVPFLPLERKHVVQCVLAEMRNEGLQPNLDVAETVAKDLTYYPKTKKLFSSKGCKTVRSKLHFYKAL